MADLARAVASLRIAGDDLIPAEVTALLKCEPTKAFAKGDVDVTRFGTRTRTFGMWSLRAEETEPADIDAQVAALLGQLPSDASLWAELTTSYHVELFCGWFMERGNEGVSVGPEALHALGTRGVLLAIDLYGGEDDEDDTR